MQQNIQGQLMKNKLDLSLAIITSTSACQISIFVIPFVGKICNLVLFWKCHDVYKCRYRCFYHQGWHIKLFLRTYVDCGVLLLRQHSLTRNDQSLSTSSWFGFIEISQIEFDLKSNFSLVVLRWMRAKWNISAKKSKFYEVALFYFLITYGSFKSIDPESLSPLWKGVDRWFNILFLE